MDKLKMQSKNLVNENIDKIASMFPNCITEGRNDNGELVKMVDFDLLKQELSHIVVEGDQERYTMNWPDKKQAILTANAPINKTLRPCEEESVGKDGTPGKFDSENLYIEGDNLDVLKLLRETYLGKIKMIYIDPPYNTGNDFVYNDDFATSTEDYLERSNQVDEDGNRMVLNNDSNGRFHTDWLNMIYPRLKLARDLLTDDGAIFISIDDNEVENLKKICSEIFGDQNFVGQWNWFKSATPPNLSKKIKKNIEYVVCYEKHYSNSKYRGIQKSSASNNGLLNQTNKFAILTFPANIVQTRLKNGIYKSGKYGTSSYEINLLEDAVVKDGKFITKLILQGKFKWSQENLNKEISNGTEVFVQTETFSPSYEKTSYDPEVPPNFINKDVGVDTTEQAGKLLNQLFNNCKVFDYPKPVDLIKYLLNFLNDKEEIVMDFFSGSGTTAHATMQLNAEDGGNRKFILVQLPEVCDEKSEAYKAGYKNICEIGKERIRRAGKKIQEENRMTAPNLDIGFRVLKLDDSNMKDVYYSPSDYTQDLLTRLESNIKEDRTPEDLLFQVMLDMGVSLSAKIEKIELSSSKTLYNVNDGDLVCCFDKNLTDEEVTQIAKLKPLYAVFRDSSLTSDSTSANFDQIFATYSPSTDRRVL